MPQINPLSGTKIQLSRYQGCRAGVKAFLRGFGRGPVSEAHESWKSVCSVVRCPEHLRAAQASARSARGRYELAVGAGSMRTAHALYDGCRE